MNKSVLTNHRLKRRSDLDWLRILAVLLLIFFHTGMIFNTWGWHIKNDQQTWIITVFCLFLNIWHMPLLFLIAGASTWFALEFRSGRVYAIERIKRLFIPLIVGMLVVIPPQVYIERLWRHQFDGSFLAFYPHFFQGLYPEGNFSWHHLWFLAYLFVFSLLALPAFLGLKKPRGRKRISRLAAFSEKPGRIFLWGLPLILIEMTLRPFYPDGRQDLISDWANFLLYLTVFVYGYLLAADPRFERTIRKNGGIALIVGLIAAFISALILTAPTTGQSARQMLLRLFIWGALRWTWLLAVLWLGGIFLNFSNKAVRYANEAVLPFYILHQTVIVVIGYPVIGWRLGLWEKFLFVSVTSLTGTLLVYELAVKRFNVVRFLFGMKPRRKGRPDGFSD